MATNKEKPGMFAGIMAMKCPQCREGNLFVKPGLYVVKDMAKMYDRCPVCNLKYEQEPGFWWGSMYLNYGFSVGIALPTFIVFFALLDFSFYGALTVAAAAVTLLVPTVFRLGRSSWIYFFGKYRSPR